MRNLKESSLVVFDMDGTLYDLGDAMDRVYDIMPRRLNTCKEYSFFSSIDDARSASII